MSKKILTIFMSVMLMLACMPMTAFAEVTQAHLTLKDDGKYINNYTQYSVTIQYDDHSHADELITVNTTIKFDSDSGRCIASADAAVTAALADAIVDVDIDDIEFYNVDGATFVKADGTSVTTMDADTYLGLATDTNGYFVEIPFGSYVKLVKPANATLVSGTKTYAIKSAIETKSIAKTAKFVAYAPYNPTTLVIPTTMTKSNEGAKLDVIGTPAVQTMDITSGHGLANVKMSFDGADAIAFANKDFGSATYNGKAHTFAITTTNVNVQYANKFDKDGKEIAEKDLKWETIAPEMVMPGTYTFYVKVSKTSAYYSNTETRTITFKINKASVSYGFAQDSFIFALGQTPVTHEMVVAEGMLASDAAAVEAYIDSYMSVKGIPAILGDNTVSISYTAPEKHELFDKYNFVAGAKNSAKVTVIEPKENIVTISTKSMTAKAKKATSKVIAAEATSGDVSFAKVSGNKKISVSEDGKIVVKKGLKSGKTYTLKVKAFVAANNMFGNATKTFTIKVKVK